MRVALLLFFACRAFAVPAFPGAEGFGAQATGGRGGAVYEVTNLDDAGPGSLRDGLSGGDRTIVFRISGTIDLKSRLDVKGQNVTIAGQTAPGDGVCLRGHELMISGMKNVIVRYLRIRPGADDGGEHDALSIRNSSDVIVDHCSLSWSTDSVNDVTHGSGKITVQWCIISEPLNKSVHQKGAHGYGTGWGGHVLGGASYHHNLIAHCESRAPRIGYMKGERGLIDCRNNVIYNTGNGSAYGGEGDDFNLIANYFRPGPATVHNDIVFDFWSDDARAFVQGNIVEDRDNVNADNRAGLRFKAGSAEKCLVNVPFVVAPVVTDSAPDAFKRVMQGAGATLPRRDAVDERIIADVNNRTGRVIDSPRDVGGWPELKSAPPPVDSDHDGLPDEWEKSHGLNGSDPADAAVIAADGYSRLEQYLNSIGDQ